MQRRGFLAGILAAGMAPAVVGSGVPMPVKKVWTPIPWQGPLTATEVARLQALMVDHMERAILFGSSALLVTPVWRYEKDGPWLELQLIDPRGVDAKIR